MRLCIQTPMTLRLVLLHGLLESYWWGTIVDEDITERSYPTSDVVRR